MQDEVIATPTPHKRVPWNKGKLTGAKPPLRPKHVWSIRTGPEAVWDAFVATHKSYPDLSADRKSQGRSASP